MQEWTVAKNATVEIPDIYEQKRTVSKKERVQYVQNLHKLKGYIFITAHTEEPIKPLEFEGF